MNDLDRRLRETDRLLTEGKNKKAYRAASDLLQDMNDAIISGPDAGRFLGLATVLRAIAAYQLGRQDEALWHWYVATQLFPDALKLKMTAYGDAGPFLKKHSLSQKKSDSENSAEQPSAEPMTNIEPPKKIHAPQPKFPRAKRKRGAKPIAVTVQIIVGTNGRGRVPRIIDYQGELTLVYATLDALRKWKFEPARRDGKPIDAYYFLKANFSVR